MLANDVVEIFSKIHYLSGRWTIPMISHKIGDDIKMKVAPVYPLFKLGRNAFKPITKPQKYSIIRVW